MTTQDFVSFFFAQNGYLVANDDTSEPRYTGYENREGQWYISKAVTSGAVITYTYAKGDSDYATHWTTRGSGDYAAVSVTFK